MVAKDQKINFAVIGCGHIGKRHAEMIIKNDESELVALVDVKNPTQLNIESYGFHAEQALKALSAKKHVVIEKPMALRKLDAENVIYKALDMHRHLFAVMQNRYSLPSVWIKNMVDSGVLGKIYMVQLNCYWNRDDRYYKSGSWHGKRDLDVGPLYTQFSHFIDTMYWLFGDIENIQARFNDFNHQHSTDFEYSGFVIFNFVKGGIGNLNYSTAVWDKNLESSMTLIAEKGSVKISGQYMSEVEYCHVKDYEMPNLAPINPENNNGSYKSSAQNHHYVIENVVDVLKKRVQITTNALEGLKVVDIIERIYSYK